MSARGGGRTLPAAVLLLALVACGSDTAAPAERPSGGEEATTPEALAYVAAEYAGPPSSAAAEGDAAEELGRGAVGAELRYGSDGEYDGDSLVVAVGPGLDPALADCGGEGTEWLAGCVRTDEGTLMWEAESPEEDPGVVYVVVEKEQGSVLLFYAGPRITTDPRDLDLPVPVSTLFAIATDPRVDVTTSPEAVAAGADLSFWDDAGR